LRTAGDWRAVLTEKKENEYKQEGYDLVGAAMEVYNVMGPGFAEAVYRECLERELNLREIPFESQPELRISYRGQELEIYYKPDLYVSGGILTELKALTRLSNDQRSQLLNYLNATGKPVGYLLNFGHPDKLEWERYIL
jgi:GxxExxY protein